MSLAEIGPGFQPKIFSFSHVPSVCVWLCQSVCMNENTFGRP